MRLIIDIGHPAHVHLFRNFSLGIKDKGHEILFTCREKEFEIELLEAAGFKYISFGKKYKSLFGKILGLLVFNFKLFLVAIKFRPDIFLSAGSMYAAHISFLLHKPHICMEDTGNMEQVKLYLPFTKIVFTPNVLKKNIGKKQYRYDAYHELAYLNPEYFTPKKNIYDFLGINDNQKYVILRLVSWNASHDIGQGGFTSIEKENIIEYLASKYALFISSEGELPNNHKKYLIKIPSDKIHHALAFADMVISEGATMASEAGVLGTPTIYVNSIVACNNEDQEKYGLVYNFRSGKGVLDKIKELEKVKNRKHKFQMRRKKLLDNKINVTSFLIWFVENYPSSLITLKTHPTFHLKFK